MHTVQEGDRGRHGGEEMKGKDGATRKKDERSGQSEEMRRLGMK